MQTFTLTQPDDWHCHFRDGDYLNTTVPATARVFARAVVMPNLKIPVCTVTEANHYRQRILDSLPNNHAFEPLMTLYLTDMTTPGLIEEAAQSSIIKACKLYPAGATTNSSLGVTQLKKIYPVLESMEKNQLPLLIHGEVTDDEIDIFDREKRFIDDILTSVVKTFPKLPIVLEHITTKDAVQYVEAAPANIGATITVHHLLYNRNKLLAGGIKPDFYCLPILKRQSHQQALLSAATSGNKKFFLGTDSAPHSTVSKYAACGCAGIFSAHGALELYAEVFEQQQSLDKLEAFASFHGADFYGLPRNSRKITLAKDPWQVPFRYEFGKESLTPLCSGETINWKVI